MNGTQWQSIRAAVTLFVSVICSACSGGGGTTTAQQHAPPKPIFRFQELMIPMRDGVHLQTVILTPVEQQGALPILFRRTPYGVPDEKKMPASYNEFVQGYYSYKEFAHDGYIFVTQNIRGRSSPRAHSQ